jgi:hypothetical protein
MSKITIYLDNATQVLVDQAALASGMSKSRWVAEVIRKNDAHEWPKDCLELAGRFADFPLREDNGASGLPSDTPARWLSGVEAGGSDVW